MHTFGESGAGVPAFLAKLWRLVDDPETNNLICWNKDGRSFIIQNQAQFARELLPLNYKHNNMASFIRQLNMYGFHKMTSIDNGGLKFDRDEMEFMHPCFKRNCPYLLEHIKRKIANTKSVDEKTALKPESVSKVLQDVKIMRGRQDSLDSRFSVMKQENEALWREIASLRQKHAKQQQIVNKLIQFLITIVQPSRNMTTVKRHMQLMINDTPENAKMRTDSESGSECGPVIHELGEELLEEVADIEPELMNVPQSPFSKVSLAPDSPSPLNMERPNSSISVASQNCEYSNLSSEDLMNAAAVGVGGANGALGNGKFVSAASPSAANGGSSIIQSINADGSQIIYHVTEVPDAHPNENANTMPANYNEDNVLTTPMVREQMARNRLLKQKNKERRKQADSTTLTDATPNTCSAATATKLQRRSGARQQLRTPAINVSYARNQNGLTNQTQQQLKQQDIKPECEIDPMLYLNIYPDNRAFTLDPQMISPNFSEDSRQSCGLNSNVPAAGLTVDAGAKALENIMQSTTPTNEDVMLNTNSNMDYNSNDFLANNVMPTDIFDDPALIANDSASMNDSYRLDEQQQFGRTTANSGNFSSFIAGNSNGASTSAAAAMASSSSNADLKTKLNYASQDQQGQGKNGKNMAITKYNKNNDAAGGDVGVGGAHPEIMRNEVHGHLENVQDELDSLKDLLRGEGYSLDASTLLGNATSSTEANNNFNQLCFATSMDGGFLSKLFSDNDVLNPYSLSLNNDMSLNDKKGSELMSYQPVYDFSDIINMADKEEMEGNVDNVLSPNPDDSRSLLQAPSSILNTPYHE